MKLCLTIVTGQRAGDQVEVTAPGGNIGRSMDAAVFLPDPSVSRQHAELSWDGHDWYLRSTTSSSTTTVDGTVASGTTVRLRPSGQLRMGIVSVEYRLAEAAALDAGPSPALRAQVAPLPAAVLRQLEPLQLSSVPQTAPSPVQERLRPVSPPVVSTDSEAPATQIRRPSPPPAVSATSEPPATLIRRPLPPPAVSAASEPPATLIRRPSPPAPHAAPALPTLAAEDDDITPTPPPLAAPPQRLDALVHPASQAAPPTLMRPVRPPPIPGTVGSPAAPPTLMHRPAMVASAKPAVVPPLPVVEHDPASLPRDEANAHSELVALRREHEHVCAERDKLRAAVVELAQEAETLRARQSQLQAQLQQAQKQAAASPLPAAVPAPPASPSASDAETLRLANELGDLLEQASQALRDGEASRASQRLRDASFALADFRDLFQSRSAAS
jgi:hypothetical protein